MADSGLALLLIPQMRRKKYTMKQTQYGRNMLIGEYLWIAYCQTLAPGEEPDPTMVRGRKKVSSHIQVLKNFFTNHRCCKSQTAHVNPAPPPSLQGCRWSLFVASPPCSSSQLSSNMANG